MKKRIIIIAIIILCLIGIYLGTHAYLTKNYFDTYAKGLKENVFGDYCINKNGYVFCANKPGLFSFTTNLSVANEKQEVSMIIWVSLVNEKKEYGVRISDDKADDIKEIEIDENGKAIDPTGQKYIDAQKEEIKRVLTDVKEVWGIEINLK